MDTLDKVGMAAACAAVVVLELVAVAGWQGWSMRSAVSQTATSVPVQRSLQPIAVATVTAIAAVQQVNLAAVAKRAQDETYYAQLRKQIRWVSTRIGDSELVTPDLNSRMMLVTAAAERAHLAEVGLGPRDVYGIINAETSWAPRSGMGKNGTPSLGIAQFEPATARALGLGDPNDAVESVHVAAVHMRQAAQWSSDRIGSLKLSALERGIKLREGVSIYYNLSSRGRSVWNGINTRRLPRETQLHILNARLGAMQADDLDEQLRSTAYAAQNRGAGTLMALNNR